MTLTREEILAMEPGQELDELICNHIFDLEMVAHVHYSSDISAAWEVEEQIKKLRLHAAYVSALKQVLVRTGEYVGMFDYIHANPEQRCKAALLAVLNL